MARKERDYTNLKETERLWDAIQRTSTHVKDYSLRNIITVTWEPANQYKRTRLVRVGIGDQYWFGFGADILHLVNEMLDEDTSSNLPRATHKLPSRLSLGKPMTVDTYFMNREGLQDHIALVSIGKNSAIVDTEELIRATRYG